MHKFEPLVFELLGVYMPVLTLLSFQCSFMVVLKPKKWTSGKEPCSKEQLSAKLVASLDKWINEVRE